MALVVLAVVGMVQARYAAGFPLPSTARARIRGMFQRVSRRDLAGQSGRALPGKVSSSTSRYRQELDASSSADLEAVISAPRSAYDSGDAERPGPGGSVLGAAGTSVSAGRCLAVRFLPPGQAG
jgi:hypothetical protein